MTTEDDKNWFKRNYCNNAVNRRKMSDDFQVSVESFEELLFEKYINSYATGERKIENAFMILSASDGISHKTYYPVFSERVAREMLRDSDIEIPQKITIFSSGNYLTGGSSNHNMQCSGLKHTRSEANKALLHLIALVRTFMLFKIDNPMPMNGVFKRIRDELIADPNKVPTPPQIKAVNTALGNYIEAHGKNKGFHHLNDFIEYVRNNCGSKQLKKIDLGILRLMFIKRYPQEKVYF